MTLDPRNLTLESVQRFCTDHREQVNTEFEAWYQSENAQVWREPLELAFANNSRQMRFLRGLLRDFAAAAWIESRIAELRGQNEESRRFLPVDKQDLLKG